MNSTNVLRFSALFAAVCAAPNWAAAQSVAPFTAVNADTGTDIATFNYSGTVSLVNAPRINVLANASSVKSMVFNDENSTRTEVGADCISRTFSGSGFEGSHRRVMPRRAEIVEPEVNWDRGASTIRRRQ